MLLNILSIFFLVAGTQGADLDYVFNDQADGWLKLYKTPATWLDAKIRCETEEAVIASPLNEKLRDALMDHIDRQNQGQRGKIIAIYTGVQADYSKGDFFSIEGVSLAQLAVGELRTSPVDYSTSESCMVWDLIGYAKLRRVKCEYFFPYVCYKRRTQIDSPTSQSRPTGQKPNSGFGVRDPENNPDSQTYVTQRLQPDQEPQNGQRQNSNSQVGYRQQSNPPTHQSYIPTYQQVYPTQNTLAITENNNNEQSQANQHTYTQTNPQSNSQQPQTNLQYLPDKRPQNNAQNQPVILPINIPQQNSNSRCITNIPNLIVVNSKDIPKLLNYITNLTSVTILFADSAHMANQGSLWHVDYTQNEDNTVRPVQVVANIEPATQFEPATNSQYNNDGVQGIPRSGSNPNSMLPNEPNDRRPVSNYNANTQPIVDDSVEQMKPSLGGQGFPQTRVTQQTSFRAPSSGNIPSYSTPPSRSPGTDYSSFIRVVGGRFKMHLQPETFETASTRCISEGAVIASPLTVDLKNEINNFVKQYSVTSPFFTGVRANLANGDYYSTEGVSLTKMPVSLNPGTFSDYQSTDSCLTMTGNDDIVTAVRCTDAYPYVCFRKSTPVRSCGNTDIDYEYDPTTQGCYKFHNDEKTWSEAYNICKSEGSHLSVLNSADEVETLRKLFKKYPKRQIKGQYKHSAYMGLRDWKDGNSWTPVQGVKKTFYKGWAPKEPRAADCSTIGRTGFLYSDSCQLKIAFICEKESEVIYDENE